MTTVVKPFDPCTHLDNETVIAEYLKTASAETEPEALLIALKNVAKAREINAQKRLETDEGVAE
ncbi:DNA-binding protein [Pseudomonas iridis]|uniref:DNA-binding protein n=1 Tax=Pseudomonas iridis TaxID=2710587 RepID=UPI0037C59DC1